MARATEAPIVVLLVEDEFLVSNLVAEWLTEGGFAVQEAPTAAEAMGYIDSGGAVDVLLTDVDLPGRMNGVDLAARVRQLRPELPIVYVSGRFVSDDIGPPVSRSLFMPKPLDAEQVCTLLTRLTAAAR